MIDQYRKLFPSRPTAKSLNLQGLKPARGTSVSRSQVEELERLLIRQGTFSFPLSTLARKDPRHAQLKVLRAASTPMWPMGTHYWVRDNALIGERLLNVCLKDKKLSSTFRKLGRQLLQSALTIMSTPTQLARFRSVIENTSDQQVRSAAQWPQIFLGIADNLSGEKVEGWAHKQDAWQILAFHVLDNLASGKLSVDDLSIEHREFLSLVTPFLARVRFYEQENSGSWEELEAVRSSVIAWDMALIARVRALAGGMRFAFLEDGFRAFQASLSVYADTSSFHAFLNDLLTRGAETLKRTIPFECPLYPASDPRHRLADGALIYLLQLDTPRLVAEMLDLPESWIAESEKKLLKTIASLFDPRTGGHRRYRNDSYQRLGFFRPETTRRLAEMYGAPSGDASGNFTGRDRVVPRGPEAAWTHFTWQLSAWAGRRYCETGDTSYLKLQQHYFLQGLRTIGSTPQLSVEQGPEGEPRIIRLPAYRCPECYLTEVDQKQRQFLFPSPHTPLNWATAEALSAFSRMYLSLA